MSRPIIEVENLGKRYRLGTVGAGSLRDEVERFLRARRGGRKRPADDRRDFWALRDISFQVQQGEVLGVIGHNGAGKSTLLKLLSRISEPTQGRAVLRGRVASLLEVGTGFHPELSGRENIFLNGAVLGMTRAEVQRKFDEIVAFAGVEKFLDTPVKRYSSGMHVRLGFAVAAHLEPEILVIDEVLAVGDASFQSKCLGKMKTVASEGRTVLFVSHTLPTIRSLCTRAIVLESGRIAYEGMVEDAIGMYRTSSAEAIREAAALPSKVLSEVVCRDVNAHEQTVFAPGDRIEICLHLSLLERVLRFPKIGIGIYNEMGDRVVTVGTYFSRSVLPHLSGEAMVVCGLDDVRLAPGRYLAKIVVSDQTCDWDTVEDLPLFTIDSTDYYGTGRLPHRKQGGFLQKSDWRTA